jgi:hypothetical protein
MGALNGRLLMSGLLLALVAIGCGRAAMPEASVKHVGHHGHRGPRHRLELFANPSLSKCDDYHTLFAHLRPAAQDSIDPKADRVLRVAIDRQGNEEKRLYVELVDDQGHIVDSVDQGLRKHMDCKRALTLAARFASELIEQSRPDSVPVEPQAKSLPTASHLPQKEKPVETAEKTVRREKASETPIARDEPRHNKPIHTRQRTVEDSKDWIDLPEKSLERDLGPRNRRENNYASPPNEVFRPLPSTESCPREQDKPSAPTISNQGSPINVTVINGDAEKEKKDEKPPPDPMIGPNISIGGGVMHGQWNRWNIAARIGAGYLSESGKFEFDVDLTGAGSKADGANGANSDIHGAFGLNVGLCGRSSPLGFCLLLSGLADVNRGSAANADWNGALGFGGGMRSWVQVPLGDTWGLRINLEMIIPIKMQDSIAKEDRIWDPLTPSGALILTLVHAMKSSEPEKKDDGKGEKAAK